MRFVYLCVAAALSLPAFAKFKYHVAEKGGQGVQWENVEMKLPADQIEGICATKTEDLIPVEIPCRGVDIELQSDTRRNIAKTKTDGQGKFSFSGLKKDTYTLVLRSPQFKKDFVFTGVKTGGSYTVSMNPPKNAE